MAKHSRVLLSGFLVSFVCLTVGVAWSQKVEPSKDAKPQPAADFQHLDDIFSLIEKDMPVEVGVNVDGGRFQGNRNRGPLGKLAVEYELQAKAGNRDAQFKIGAMRLEGLGGGTNYTEAARWFSLAGGPDHPFVHLAEGMSYLWTNEPRLDRTQRENVIRALGQIGPESEPAIPILEQEIGRDWPLGSAAAIALGHIGDRGISILIKELESRDVGRRRAAAEGLSEAGEAARRAIPQLTEALKDEDSKTREYAKHGLLRLKVKEQSK